MEDPNNYLPDEGNQLEEEESSSNKKKNDISDEIPQHYSQPKEKYNRPQSAKHDPPIGSEPKGMDNSIRIKAGEQIYPQSKQLNPILYNNFNFSRGAYANNTSLNSKVKAKYILHDKEQLYDESIKLKEELHKTKVENTQWKTKVQQYEKELTRKEKEIEEIVTQFHNNNQNANRLIKGKAECHLINTLKKQVKDLRTNDKAKEEEISNLRKNIKVTKLQEMETEMKMYIDECTRLKHLLEDVIQQKSISGQEDYLALEQRLAQQSNLLKIAKQENVELANEYKIMEAELQKWKSIAVEYDKKGKNNNSKDLQNAKKLAESYKKEYEKMKLEMSASKSQNKNPLQAKVEQLTNHSNNLTLKLEYSV